MGWRRRLRVFLSPYRNLPILERRKAEFSLLVSGLMSVLLALRLGLEGWLEGTSLLWWAQAVVFPTLLALGLVVLARGRLEVQVNLLIVVAMVQCALLLPSEISRHFFVLCFFSMVVFSVLALRSYQKVTAFIGFPLLVGLKSLWDLLNPDRALASSGDETAVTVAVFLAAIPLMNFLMAIVDREIRHTERLLDQNVNLKKEAGTDRLTGTWNRRHFDQLARREIAEAQRTERPLALVFLDLDWFKKVNDEWGHHVGDEALTELVRTVMLVLRQGDSMVRWGGDEFVVLCPGVGPSDAAGLGDKILESVRLAPALRRLNLGVSVGIAIWRPNEPIQDLVNRADQLLYRAKGSGRDRAVVEGLDTSPPGVDRLS